MIIIITLRVLSGDPTGYGAATCGLSSWDAGHATGIVPQVWGETIIWPFGLTLIRTMPIAFFAGNQDNLMQEINDTGDFIRERNNLNGTFFIVNPYSDVQLDQTTTQRRTFVTAADATKPSSPFRRFLAQGAPNQSATHGIPDADECPGAGAVYGDTFMTCDYSYTDETRAFFELHADLNLNP